MAQEPLWYYLEGQDVRGPVAAAQLRQMARARQIHPNTQICKAGTEEWMEASRLRLEFGAPGGGMMGATAHAGGGAGAPGFPGASEQSAVGGEHNLFSPTWILDFRFKKFVTPQIVRVYWILYVAAVILATIYITVMLFRSIIYTRPVDWIYPIAFFLGEMLGILMSMLMFRMLLEFFMNFFYMSRRDD